MSEKSKKNQTIQYYDQNAADFVENTRNVDFHVMQDEFIEGLPAGVDAIDGSAELCALASEYTGIPVKCQLFQELDASEVYDGIWACSSLLHLSYGELDEVLYRIEKALKPQGILYMSFKYGVFEGERNGRYFLDLTEEKLEQLLKKHTSLQQLRNFLTEDVRPDREERWLNLFLKKINS